MHTKHIVFECVHDKLFAFISDLIFHRRCVLLLLLLFATFFFASAFSVNPKWKHNTLFVVILQLEIGGIYRYYATIFLSMCVYLYVMVNFFSSLYVQIYKYAQFNQMKMLFSMQIMEWWFWKERSNSLNMMKF